MSLHIRHDEPNQQFTAYLNEEEIGELAYARPDDSTIDFQHTFIEPDHRGKGNADELIRQGLEYAKQQNLQVIATCRAVASYQARHK